MMRGFEDLKMGVDLIIRGFDDGLMWQFEDYFFDS